VVRRDLIRNHANSKPRTYILSPIAQPMQHPHTHNTTDASAYASATPALPCWNNCIVCALNAENVVNPPRIPTVRNCRVAGLIRTSDAPRTKPISADPSTFTIKVPHGNTLATRVAMTPLNQCRATPPRPLPIAISKYAFTALSYRASGGLHSTSRGDPLFSARAELRRSAK
jgi:hypothetical protein